MTTLEGYIKGKLERLGNAVRNVSKFSLFPTSC